jgi:hypothetical protein
MNIQVFTDKKLDQFNIQVEFPYDPDLISQQFIKSLNPNSSLYDRLKSNSSDTEPTNQQIAGYTALVGDWLFHLKIPSNLSGYFDKNSNKIIIQGDNIELGDAASSVDAFNDNLRARLICSLSIDDNNASTVPSGGFDLSSTNYFKLNRLPSLIYDKNGKPYELKVFDLSDESTIAVKYLTELYINTHKEHGPKNDKTAIRIDPYGPEPGKYSVFIIDSDNPNCVVGIVKLREFKRIWPIEDLGGISTQFTNQLKSNYTGIHGGLVLEYIEINRRRTGLARAVIKQLQKLPFEFITLDAIDSSPTNLYTDLGFKPSERNELKFKNYNFLAMTLTWFNEKLR